MLFAIAYGTKVQILQHLKRAVKIVETTQQSPKFVDRMPKSVQHKLKGNGVGTLP